MKEVKLAKSDQDIAKCFPVMYQLRPKIKEETFVETTKRLATNESYQLAYLEHDGKVETVAGFKITENLDIGKFIYVDDLVTSSDVRSSGDGKIIMDWLAEYGKKYGCIEFILDSATFRFEAHKFYFKNNFHIYCYHFSKEL